MDINLTPLIDVVFLLLIFFMVSTTFDRDAELGIELPQAAGAPAEAADEALTVSIDARGRYFVNGQLLINTQLETLMSAMRGILAERDDPPVVIHADGSAQHQAVVKVMDAAQQLGLARLRFTTSARPAGTAESSN